MFVAFSDRGGARLGNNIILGPLSNLIIQYFTCFENKFPTGFLSDRNLFIDQVPASTTYSRFGPVHFLIHVCLVSL